MKGWLALDIDGTLTTDKYQVPSSVMEFLQTLYYEGWKIILSTGRTYSFSKMILQQFSFPFLVSVQNGSTVLAMPERNVMIHYSLKGEILSVVKNIVKDSDCLMIVYSGYDQGKDICYWKNTTLKEEYLQYIEDLRHREAEEWRKIEDYNPQIIKSFSLIKIIGTKDVLVSLLFLLKKQITEEIAFINDPFDKRYYLLLITNRNASKGKNIENLTKEKTAEEIVIAAGNDDNDFSLLKAADYKIAMPTSPKHLLEIADLVAPPVEEHGIIFALKEAIRSYNQ